MLPMPRELVTQELVPSRHAPHAGTGQTGPTAQVKPPYPAGFGVTPPPMDAVCGCGRDCGQVVGLAPCEAVARSGVRTRRLPLPAEL